MFCFGFSLASALKTETQHHRRRSIHNEATMMKLDKSGYFALLLVPWILITGTAFQFQPSHVQFFRPNLRSTQSITVRNVALIPDQHDPTQVTRRYGDFNDGSTEDDIIGSKSSLDSFQAAVTKCSMIAYIASMCVVLPVTLGPIWILHKLGMISISKREHVSLPVAEQCAKFLLYIIPFVELTITSQEEQKEEPPIPSIWCANHVSALDTFLFLATDHRIRGKHRRPLKVIYWKGLDENPVTKLLFHMAGFIPVQMEANGSGNPNEYDRGSFLSMLRSTKQAFQEGFDVFILPEGQLNPTPDRGLLQVFPGAFSLAKMSHRPIRFVGIYGTDKLWHADDDIGMAVTGKQVKIRTYPQGRDFESAEDFINSFKAIVGHFGSTGTDLPENELENWLIGR